jgi:hypothetical protein
MAATNFTVIRGDCLPVNVIYQLNSANPPGWPTNYIAELAADWNLAANFILYRSDSGVNRPTLGLDASSLAQILSVFPASMTTTWPVGVKMVQYQLRLTDPTGCNSTLLYGAVTVTEAPVVIAGG